MGLAEDADMLRTALDSGAAMDRAQALAALPAWDEARLDRALETILESGDCPVEPSVAGAA